MKKVTLESIAERLGVSVVTVHKALKNQKGVSENLRERIVALAYELGYTAAGNDALNFLYLIHKNFILSPNEQFYSQIYHNLNLECLKSGAKLHLVVHDNLDSTMHLIRSAASEFDIDGIFVSGQVDHETLSALSGLKKPVTCIDFFSSDFPFDYIYVDNYYAGYLLTKYLIKKGHRDIGFLGNIRFSNAIADRYFGYLRALNKYGIPRDDALHIDVNIEQESRPALLERLPSAFICHCDRAASVLYGQLKSRGYSVPGDISIISFDNTDLCEHLDPRLTSFGIEKEKFSAQAFNTMLDRVHRKDTVLNYTKLNLELFERDSVRDLSQKSRPQAETAATSDSERS